MGIGDINVRMYKGMEQSRKGEREREDKNVRIDREGNMGGERGIG